MDYIATPSGTGPGVLVAHDWYGLLPHVRERCDDLAAAGFVVYAPDLFDGRTAADPDEAAMLLGQLDDTLAEQRLVAGLDALRAHPAVAPPRCAAVGYSMGGTLALRLAATGVLDALVVYYATVTPEVAARVTCPVLALFAEIDDWDPPEAPLLFLDALRAASPRVEDVTYPGTLHSFANADVPLCAPLAAERAWARTMNFLREHLLE